MFFKHSTLLLCALAVFVGPMMFDSVSAADVASPARFDSSSATSITTTSLEGAYTAQEFDLSKIEALHVVPSGNGTVSVDYEGMGLDGDDHQHRLQRRYHYRAGAAPTWHKWMRRCPSGECCTKWYRVNVYPFGAEGVRYLCLDLFLYYKGKNIPMKYLIKVENGTWKKNGWRPLPGNGLTYDTIHFKEGAW